MKPPEKKKRKTKSSSLPPSFFSLPDEITVNCVARMPRSCYPTLSIVSKTFRSLVSSSELYAERSRIGKTEHCLYVYLAGYKETPQCFTLWDNPNRTLPDSSVTKKKKKKKTKIPKSLVSIPPCNFPGQSNSIVVVASQFYVMGGVYGVPSSAMRVLDCRSNTWRDAPSMKIARERAYSCVYDGKIYVLGGYKGFEKGMRKGLEDDEPWAEVFDTKTQTWGCLPDPGTEIRKCYVHKIREMEGKIKFGDSYKTYGYDTKQSKWECYENESATFPRSECVIENVSYRNDRSGLCMCEWYDVNDGEWKEVKGLDSLRNKYRRNGGSSNSFRKLVSFGGKLLLIWIVYKRHADPSGMSKIWCAEIVLEKRDGGEIWGSVEWVDIVHTFPTTCYLLHCVAVSV